MAVSSRPGKEWLMWTIKNLYPRRDLSNIMPSDRVILYCGDTALGEASSYLAGVMAHFSISFDYLASSEEFKNDYLVRAYRAVILSDYPAMNFTPNQMEKVTDRIRRGMGLMMIGGWASFTGVNGGYAGTALGKLLPVIMEDRDDRVNGWQPCIVERLTDHVIVENLPFESHAPTIGGFNRFRAVPGAETILSARQVEVSHEGGRLVFEPSPDRHPLLVVSEVGSGRVAAFASDVAPHWVGGLVDWGDSRIRVQAQGAGVREVGNWYATLFERLIRWVIRDL